MKFRYHEAKAEIAQEEMRAVADKKEAEAALEAVAEEKAAVDAMPEGAEKEQAKEKLAQDEAAAEAKAEIFVLERLRQASLREVQNEPHLCPLHAAIGAISCNCRNILPEERLANRGPGALAAFAGFGALHTSSRTTDDQPAGSAGSPKTNHSAKH